VAGDSGDSDSWKDVLDQVAKALGDVEPKLRDALVDGVRVALDTVAQEVQADEADEADEEPPPKRSKVVVLDGGRRSAPEDRASASPEGPRVHVVREEPPLRRTPLSHEGRIRVRPGEPVEWQTIWRGDAVRAYRVLCATGTLEVALDGVPAEKLRAGQSLDVEARLVRVRSGDTGVGLGSYVRLTGA
jgi:hypothetical protein